MDKSSPFDSLQPIKRSRLLSGDPYTTKVQGLSPRVMRKPIHISSGSTHSSSDQDIVNKLIMENHSLKQQLSLMQDKLNSFQKQNDDLAMKNISLEKQVKELSMRAATGGNAKKKSQSRYWGRDEHEKFIEALELFGRKDVKSISAYVGSRTPTQVRTHAQKYFLKIKRENDRKNQEREREHMQREEHIQREFMRIKDPNKISRQSSYNVEINVPPIQGGTEHTFTKPTPLKPAEVESVVRLEPQSQTQNIVPSQNAPKPINLGGVILHKENNQLRTGNIDLRQQNMMNAYVNPQHHHHGVVPSSDNVNISTFDTNEEDEELKSLTEQTSLIDQKDQLVPHPLSMSPFNLFGRTSPNLLSPASFFNSIY